MVDLAVLDRGSFTSTKTPVSVVSHALFWTKLRMMGCYATTWTGAGGEQLSENVANVAADFYPYRPPIGNLRGQCVPTPNPPVGESQYEFELTRSRFRNYVMSKSKVATDSRKPSWNNVTRPICCRHHDLPWWELTLAPKRSRNTYGGTTWRLSSRFHDWVGIPHVTDDVIRRTRIVVVGGSGSGCSASSLYTDSKPARRPITLICHDL
jgi:hypothetical protein